MKSWRCGSLAAGSGLAGAFLAMALPLAGLAPTTGAKRANEVTLARLRPGRDTLRTATGLYGQNFRQVVPGASDVLAWVDPKHRRMLRIELDAQNVIQSITVSSVDPQLDAETGAEATLPGKYLVTGRGLGLDDLRSRVVDLYGAPGSSGPSAEEHRELELLYYAFDWAGSDVPQVMEVYCDRPKSGPGRVAEITLAYPSL